MGLFFPWKIARLSYAVRNVIMNVIVWPLFLNWQEGLSGEGRENAALVWAFWIVIGIYWAIGVALPRCRDAGLPAWSVWLVFAPGVNLLLALALLGTGSKLEPFAPQATPLAEGKQSQNVPPTASDVE